MELSNILVPTDFSVDAEQAFQEALALAAREHVQVLLLHVLLRCEGMWTDVAWPIRRQLMHELQTEAEQRLQTVAARQRWPIETLAVWGNASTEICRIAREYRIDLIVMSTHGRTGLAHMFRGSVAERVVRSAPCAVLIVRPSQPKTARGAQSPVRRDCDRHSPGEAPWSEGVLGSPSRLTRTGVAAERRKRRLCCKLGSALQIICMRRRTDMAEHSVVGIYDTMAQAEEAVYTLAQAGFPVKHVSIVTQSLASDKTIHGYITPGDDLTPRGAATGAWMGGLLSVLIGAAFLWVPGFGPLLVLGRLATLLLAGVEGALLGAATGSFLGALANWGIAEEQILDYAQQVQSGKHVVIAYGTAEEVAQAQAILQGTAVGAVRVHAGTRAERPPEAMSQGISGGHSDQDTNSAQWF